MSVAVGSPRVGELLRSWRQRRSLSQLELSLESEVSARHLSFIETGRARPSREMVLHLAERLDVPLRERNSLLLAAGFAPLYGERSLDSEEMTVVTRALDRFLRAHEPYPAVVVDRHWTLVSANDALGLMLEGVAGHLLEPPANALRVALHPDGMAPGSSISTSGARTSSTASSAPRPSPPTPSSRRSTTSSPATPG
jgi:transcriptional regulator with XRE-family HTH domain